MKLFPLRKKALLLQKPLVILNLLDRKYIIPFVESGVAEEVKTVEELPQRLSKTLNDKNLKLCRERFIADYVAYFSDSTSCFKDLIFWN